MGNCLIVRKGSQPEGTANTSQVLSGATFQSANSDDLQTGTMPNNGAVVANVYDGDDYYIPKGYHDGSGHIKNASQLYHNVNWVQAQYTTEKYSDICYTRATTQLNYLITCTAHGDTSYAKVEGSNDGTNWTVLKEVDCTGGYSVLDDIATGYTQYRSYVKANGSGPLTTLHSTATCKMSYFI